MKASLIFAIATFAVCLGCKINDCPQLPDEFASIDQAIKTIRNTNSFSIDSFRGNGGSNIRIAEYFTCNKQIGYIIYSFKDASDEHFFSQVPAEVWDLFKNSPNKDSFLFKQLKGKYYSTAIYVTDQEK